MKKRGQKERAVAQNSPKEARSLKVRSKVLRRERELFPARPRIDPIYSSDIIRLLKYICAKPERKPARLGKHSIKEEEKHFQFISSISNDTTSTPIEEGNDTHIAFPTTSHNLTNSIFEKLGYYNLIIAEWRHINGILLLFRNETEGTSQFKIFISDIYGLSLNQEDDEELCRYPAIKFSITRGNIQANAIPIGRIYSNEDLTLWVVMTSLSGEVFCLKAEMVSDEELWIIGSDGEEEDNEDERYEDWPTLNFNNINFEYHETEVKKRDLFFPDIEKFGAAIGVYLGSIESLGEGFDAADYYVARSGEEDNDALTQTMQAKGLDSPPLGQNHWSTAEQPFTHNTTPSTLQPDLVGDSTPAKVNDHPLVDFFHDVVGWKTTPALFHDRLWMKKHLR
ncbi:hypothetical protein BJ875DRAFT_446868 [Amylocarpus encephaloides]|uniref:Uncharacterized protein n=1 Tax=Amylocarpus encephaloides TaxID=45428 RepID=A0A9P7Y7E5_9HELO|nr:hypothetical protein BJ875DRAFT_446868 [Amylocarpus encephaloides]